MSIIEIRRANQEDSSLIHSMLMKSKGDEFKLSIQTLRQDLSSSHDVDVDLHTKEDLDASFEFDMKLVRPNCPVCQAYLACIDGVYVGHLIYHYFYSPWRGRMVFVDDMFVDKTFMVEGVTNKLLDSLKALCRGENFSFILFNSTDVSREFMDTIGRSECKVIRDENTDWSVYRVDFAESKNDLILPSSSGQSAEGC